MTVLCFELSAVMPSRARCGAAAVVEALDVLEDRVGELDPRSPALTVAAGPAFFAREVKAQEVNWVPWSPWMIAPGDGRRESMAMPRAFVARSERWAVSMAQPTTRRLNTSITTPRRAGAIPARAGPLRCGQ